MASLRVLAPQAESLLGSPAPGSTEGQCSEWQKKKNNLGQTLCVPGDTESVMCPKPPGPHPPLVHLHGSSGCFRFSNPLSKTEASSFCSTKKGSHPRSTQTSRAGLPLGGQEKDSFPETFPL